MGPQIGGGKKIHLIGKDTLCRSKLDGGLGFRDLNIFNSALLARQLWRLMQRPNSLVWRLLKAKYFPNCGILDARLGSRPSYTWRSLCGARWVIEGGSRWRVADGFHLSIWESKWLPRPSTFKVITPFNPQFSLLRVGDFIDRDNGSWKEDMVNLAFLPVDAEIIMNIPLSLNFPPDRLIWHFSSNGELTVKSAYHFILQRKRGEVPQSSTCTLRCGWKFIWSLAIPPRMRMFAWRVCAGALPSAARLAHRIPNFAMKCSVCGAMEETDMHTLFECPLASEVWLGIKFGRAISSANHKSVWDVLVWAREVWGDAEAGNFVAVMWMIWNSRNQMLFGKLEDHPSVLGLRAIKLVEDYSECNAHVALECGGTDVVWRPPDPGTIKLNFDAGKIAGGNHGWGVVARDASGDIIFSGSSQGSGFLGPELEEARACRFALQEALKLGIRNAIVEGDFQALISKL